MAQVHIYPEFFCEPHKLLNLNNTEPVLIALSGGADSCALLHLLKHASLDLGFDLYAAHVNHNIRTDSYGGEAERDEQFCHELCASLGVKLFTQSIDVPTLAKEKKTSLETAAREIRYSFFAKIMTENKINILATAHNADDNLETQIFNLARGCGIDGMRGIPQVRDFSEVDGGVIVRPIISAAKADIISFCRENDFDFVTDSTNFEDDCTRNRIRHNIIPELCSLFGTPQRAAMRLSNLASADAEYLDMIAQKYLDDANGKIALSSFNSLHRAIASRVISKAYSNAAGACLEQAHVDAVIKLAISAVPHSSVSLPRKMAAKIENNSLVFVSDEKKNPPESFLIALKEGLNVTPDGEFVIFIGDGAPEQNFEISRSTYSYYSSAKLCECNVHSLTARNREDGDIIRNGGMTKKVKKLLCDKKVAIDLRNSLPLICLDGQIVYIPVCAVADDVRVGQNNKHLQITIYKKERTEVNYDA